MNKALILICILLAGCAKPNEFTPEEIYLLQTTCLKANGQASIYGGFFTFRPVTFHCIVKDKR